MPSVFKSACVLCMTLLGLAWETGADAGLRCHPSSGATGKCCDCAPGYQPRCCRPQIVRPQSFHGPQCRHGGAKPDACYSCECPGNSCCPVATCVPTTPGPCLETGSCLPSDACCATGTPCELATLIRESQTACHSWERRDAVHKLSDRYSCKCFPEVMPALVYALNDPDERVRSKAADEIGDQLRCSPQCCSCSVLSALKYALGDCDRFVRRQAEEALRAAGYDVVEGVCDTGGCELTCVPRIPSMLNMPAAAESPTSSLPPVDPNDSPTAGNMITPPAGQVAAPPAEPKRLPEPAADQYSPSPDAPVPAVDQTPPEPASAPTAAAPQRFYERARAQPIRAGLTELFNR